MKKTLFSFEVFPPKKDSPIEGVYQTLDDLRDLKPDFISVTFGAGGSSNCDNTLKIASRIKDVCGVDSVCHLPAINMSREECESVLTQFRDAGIKNIHKLLIMCHNRIFWTKLCILCNIFLHIMHGI